MAGLKEYVEREMGKGFSKEQIAGVLRKYNYSDDEISKAFFEANVPVERKLPLHHFWRFLIVLIVVIVLVGAVLYFIQNTKLKQTETPPQSAKTIEAKSGTECDTIVNSNDRDICLLKLSKQKDDTSLCPYISEGYIKTDCNSKLWNSGTCDYEYYLGQQEYIDCMKKQGKMKEVPAVTT